MKKIFYLSSCSTCAQIIKDLKLKEKGFQFQDIKTEKISPSQLDEMVRIAGSYEELFSRRALKYKELGLADKKLGEKDYRKYILEEYTFLKRPVIILKNKLFAGSSKKTIEKVRALL